MVNNSTDDTIAAISTAAGDGGIGIVRISGPGALEIADGIFVSRDGKAPSKSRTFTMQYGHIVNNGSGGRVIDEVILSVMKAPKSYTKEDIIEINCHGGSRALKEVLDLVIKRGARVSEPGEFTKRAFLNGRIDLAQAEAVLDAIRAKTEASLTAAMGQLEGGLSKDVGRIRERVIDITSEVEASIDFPEEGPECFTGKALMMIGEVISDIGKLIDTSRDGIILRDGALAVICGKPNVGKSSLMNLLLKRDRVIVTPVPGTTRDAVEEMISLRGIPIRLVDTAGIADTEDVVEKEGIKRSKSYLRSADLALLLLDASTGIAEEDLGMIKLAGPINKIVIINKIDLASKIDRSILEEAGVTGPVVEVSVRERKNIDMLEEAIVKMVWGPDARHGEGTIVSNARHKELLDKALADMLSAKKAIDGKISPELVAIDLKEAIFDLGLIIGKSVSDDILDKIFGQFCIGK